MSKDRFARAGLVSSLALLSLVACGSPDAERPAGLEPTAFGTVATQADLDGDGRADVAVGDTSSADRGRVLVFRSSTGNARAIDTLLAPPSATAEDARRFGSAVATQDVDGDGRPELVVGAAESHALVFRNEGTGLVYWKTVDASAFGLTKGAPARAEAPTVGALELQRISSPPTPLQQHVIFFDRNGDHKITLSETYIGLRAIGVDPVTSGPIALAINVALAPPTSGIIPPTLSINIDTIDFGKHGSDSEIYDDNGYFRADRFEEFFATWDRNRDGGLDLGELAARTIVEADLFDFFGVIASTGEFGLLWIVAQENGRISKARFRALYDGSLFYALEAERRWP